MDILNSPGGPVVKTLCSMQGVGGSTPESRELRTPQATQSNKCFLKKECGYHWGTIILTTTTGACTLGDTGALQTDMTCLSITVDYFRESLVCDLNEQG